MTRTRRRAPCGSHRCAAPRRDAGPRGRTTMAARWAAPPSTGRNDAARPLSMCLMGPSSRAVRPEKRCRWPAPWSRRSGEGTACLKASCHQATTNGGMHWPPASGASRESADRYQSASERQAESERDRERTRDHVRSAGGDRALLLEALFRTRRHACQEAFPIGPVAAACSRSATPVQEGPGSPPPSSRRFRDRNGWWRAPGPHRPAGGCASCTLRGRLPPLGPGRPSGTGRGKGGAELGS
mgnify:CR=1 FL=1